MTMSTFDCPQCGEQNEYDPWSEQAACRQCGFSPPDGQEMLGYLRQQETASDEEVRPDGQPDSDSRTRLTRFLPTDGRSFLSGLAWGVLVFALIMFLGSTLEISGSVVRCLALLLPFLTTFAVWRWQAWRECGE